MKKLILAIALMLTTMTVSANSIRYFTRTQAARVSSMLDAQNELMIYCGYEYELATYVIINEVWAEPVNSKYYEIWLYGYDAYTGEEIYMPIDLACIWLYNYNGSRIYSAAQYLRFRTTVSMPNFYWTMPPYNAFTRMYHDPHFGRRYTYHYEVHRYGWRPPAYDHHGPMPYHPYYMRNPHTPAPVATVPFTPGRDYPQTTAGHNYIGSGSRGVTDGGTRSTTSMTNGGSRSGNNSSNTGNPGTTNRGTSTSGTSGRGTSTTGTSGTTGTSSRGTSTGTTTGRGTSTTGTSGTTGNSSRGTSTGTSTGRGTSTTGTSGTTGSSSRGTSTGTSTGRGTSTTGTSGTTGTSSRGTSTSRSTSTSGTSTSGTSTSGTSTSGTTNRGTSTTTETTTGRGTGTSSGRSSGTTNNGSTRTR